MSEYFSVFALGSVLYFLGCGCGGGYEENFNMFANSARGK